MPKNVHHSVGNITLQKLSTITGIEAQYLAEKPPFPKGLYIPLFIN